MRWEACAILCGAALGWSAGCSTEPRTQVQARADAGPRSPDGGVSDAGGAPPNSDADVHKDAGAPAPACDPVSGSTHASYHVPFATASGYAIAPAGLGFQLAYRLDPGCDQVLTAVVPTDGSLPSPAVAMGDTGCAAFRDLALLPQQDGSAWLAFTDNSAGSAELFVIGLDTQLAVRGTRLRITDNAAQEHSPALSYLHGTTMLSFLESDDSGTHIVTRRFQEQIEENRRVVPATMGHRPQTLVLSPLGQNGAALAWVDEGGGEAAAPTGVFIQPLAADGSALGTPVALNPLAGPGASVDLSSQTRRGDDAQGGAAVYSIQVGERGREVRFQRLTEAGARRGSERKLLSAPLLSRDASITALGEGYAVAYRALPDGTLIDTPQIRLLFLTAEGTVRRDAQGRPLSHRLADATRAVGRITLRSSLDGQLLVSWLDDAPNGTERLLQLHRVRLDCL